MPEDPSESLRHTLVLEENKWELTLAYGSAAGAVAEWGTVTGTLSDQTDLQTALNGKQATLVSGTTLKSVNSQSLLGSGNLDITIPSASITDAASAATPNTVVKRDGFGDAAFRQIDLSVPLAVADGGTGASTSAHAKTNLGLGSTDSPTFADVTITDDLSVGDDATISGDVSIGGSLTLVTPYADMVLGVESVDPSSVQIRLFSGANNDLFIEAGNALMLSALSGVNVNGLQIESVDGRTFLTGEGGTSVKLAVPLALDSGGTGAATASAARTNLGLGTANSPQFTSLSLTGSLTGTVNYNNSVSGLDATTVKDAIDLLEEKKVNVVDLAANLILYPTSVPSDVSGYNKLVSSIDDSDYDTVAEEITTATITTSGQLVASLVSDAGLIDGAINQINVSTIGQIRRVSGTKTAEFYFEIYRRDSDGDEFLIAGSSPTPPVTSGTFEQFSESAIISSATFTLTDRIVIKYYANVSGTGSNPVYAFEFGGTDPVRTLIPVPAATLIKSLWTPLPGGDIYYNGSSNVGIGTNAPARTLHVDYVLRLEPTSAAPASPAAGDIYFDSDDNKLKCFDGTSWQNCF